ncbi:serine/threonine-protein kinase bud32 [Taxawa tesnikishii (nom. ined.)]|nr:serine/threonine-protein kinase bud32 [Dothideales sp. JES 119]
MPSISPPPSAVSLSEASSGPTHTLPSPFSHSANSANAPVLLTQGAEALVYRTTFLTPSTPCALKFRPTKPYRHPILDRRLTRARILAETRVLVRCKKEGVSVPAVLGLDWEAGWVALEWVAGWTVRRCLDWFYHGAGVDAGEMGAEERTEELRGLMARVGRAVGRLHDVGVVHGDLTTSNLMLRPDKDSGDGEREMKDLKGDVVLIDFGLAQQSVQEEDKAVDLYVLERAFGSTHPEAEDAFKDVLKAYAGSYKGAKVVLKRLEDVRMRGRKKSMIG